MNYSLWRNGQHLGDVVYLIQTFEERGIMAGVFQPTPSFHDLAPVIQIGEILPGLPVQQVDPTQSSGPGPVALRPMTDEEMRDVPAERQFEVRDPAGVTS